MKRNKMGRAAMATMMSLAVGLGVTACSRDYTVAYVYATSAQTGGVSGFEVDYQSGSLVQIAGSPFASNLTNPISLVTSPDSKSLYIIGGSQDNKVLQMSIGTDGKLYGQHTYNITGSIPTSAAIDGTGSFLYVTYTLQNTYTTVSPGPGGLTIFPINKDGSLGTPVNQNLGNAPVGVVASNLQACNTSTATGGSCPALPAPCNSITTAAANPTLCHYVYVVDADTNASGVGAGQILGFIQASATALTTLTNTSITTVGGRTVGTGYNSGVAPSAIAIDPTNRFVYTTDKQTNQLLGYTVAGTTAPGSLTPLVGNPFLTGLFPVAVTIEPRGKFMYTANFGANTIGTYVIDPASGNPSGVVGSGNAAVATGPTCVSVEPALGIYLFTSNRLDGSLSGAQLDPHNGSLKNIANTPFQASAQLSCVATAANGEHASSLVNP